MVNVVDEKWEKMLREMEIEDVIQDFNFKTGFKSLKEEQEFRLLCYELEEKHFKFSSQLSDYITSTRIGYKYKHISGWLTFEKRNSEWELNGGVPKPIFRLLCRALNLENDLPYTKTKDFISYADLEKNLKESW